MARPRKPWNRKSNKRWYVEVNGKQVDLGKEKKEAFRRFHALMAQPEPKQETRNSSNISLVEIVEHFLDWVQKNRAADTYEWYRFRLERLCRKFPILEAHQLKPFMVQEWVNEFDLSITSLGNYLRATKRCFKWSKTQGYIDLNPISDIEIPSPEVREVSLTQEDFDILMSHVINPRMADLMTVTWETGCRPQESLRVEARHVDLEHQRWVFQRSESKTKRTSRVVYLTDKAFELTKRLMLENPTGSLFRNSKGRKWTTDAVNCSVDAIRVRIGKEEMRRQEIKISEDDIEGLIPSLKKTRVVKRRKIHLCTNGDCLASVRRGDSATQMRAHCQQTVDMAD